MHWIIYFILLFSLMGMFGRPISSQSSQASEWEVSAQCLSHSETSGPQGMQVRYMYQTHASGAQLQGFLTVDGGLNLPSSREGWDTPNQGWVSVLFKGPPIQSKLYCQDVLGPKTLHLSYYPHQGSKIYFSPQEMFSNQELDFVDGGAPKSHMTLWPGGEAQNEYLAGAGTPNPYWLQFSVPIHSPHSIETAIRYSVE